MNELYEVLNLTTRELFYIREWVEKNQIVDPFIKNLLAKLVKENLDIRDALTKREDETNIAFSEMLNK